MVTGKKITATSFLYTRSLCFPCRHNFGVVSEGRRVLCDPKGWGDNAVQVNTRTTCCGSFESAHTPIHLVNGRWRAVPIGVRMREHKKLEQQQRQVEE